MTPAETTPFLAHIPLPHRHHITERAVVRTLGRGAVLYLAGDPCRWTYLVTGGAIKLVGRDERGGEVVVGLALPGDLLGVEAAIDGLPQPTDAIAMTRSTALGLDTSVLRRCIEDGEAAVALARILSLRLRGAYSSALERAGLDAVGRIAARIGELARVLGRPDGDGIEVQLPVPKADLAALSGMCRESASKAFGRLKQSGIIDYRGRTVRILRPAELERLGSCGSLQKI